MLLALIPRGWMVLGLMGIAYAFILAPDSGSQTRLALSIGGVLLVFQSLVMLVQNMQSVAVALAMRVQIDPLLQAAARPGEDPIAAFTLLAEPEPERPGDKRPLLTARGISFRYHTGGRFVLQGCNVQIHEGDRWLLEGPSGGGKSTLASVLAGMRMPQSGLIQLRGFDRQTVSSAIWRRRVVIAPQFHENHVFTESLAFNLLMGRRWPPQPQDLLEAEAVCRELGLGELLDRLPDGLLQIVGEGGWRLSHGERSRLYIARAILQKADLIILDESFGALDPESLQKALLCTHNRAQTLLVIAHP
jgi:ATP-binding cassette subfamily B protein